jgi:cytoskeletal protein RodZ
MINEIPCSGCGKVHPLWIAADAKLVNCSECGTQVEQRHVEQHEVQPQLSGGGDKVNLMWMVGGLSAVALLLLVLCGVGGGAYYFAMTPRAEEPDTENFIAKTQPNVIEEDDNSPNAIPPVSADDKQTATEEIAAADKAADEKAADEKAADEKAADEKAADEKAATDKAATDKAATDKAATDKAATDKAAADKAAADKAATDKAADEKAAAENPGGIRSAPDKPAGGDSPPASKGAPEIRLGGVLKGNPSGNTSSGRENGISLYGVQVVAEKIAYVIDYSSSMNGPKLQSAKREVYASVGRLTERQIFTVVLFNTLYYAKPEFFFKHPNPQTKNRLAQWLNQQLADGGTNPLPALNGILRGDYDVVFLVSDGEFLPGTVNMIRTLNRKQIPISTISLGFQSRSLKRIAHENNGQYITIR